ncbi:hypothetical protein GJ744_002779 [Endocarpon pusillum]|uniref:GET complex, subunit GET2 n=1 Tax=Endocarpon pusillum TaxID=364733 RepID=A0A8H7E9U4_9EURO|nr:hypothetical protein GJ744_002779 [Endocarpon pusillum]
MSEAEESAAQRQARIRREKREAKIKAGGSERLEKITKLSGRTAETMRNSSPSPSASPAPPSQTPPITSQPSDPSQIRAQEEFLHSMLRAQDPQQQGQATDQQQQQMPEDPMMKLLSSLAGGENSTDPNNPTGLPFSPEDIQSATGMPSWATSLLMGGKGKVPATAEERKTATIWNMVHIIFSILAGAYLLSVLGGATEKFGKEPPPPATAKNPFLAFALGELLIHASRVLMKDPASTQRADGWLQILKDVARDGSIVLFILGAANWWNGTAA